MEKVALVTGGNSGIGYATAKLLKAKGYDVYISGRNADRVQQAAVELDVKSVVADMSNSSDVEQLSAIFLEDGLDILVNNAGIANLAPLERITHEVFLEIFNTNVWGVLQLIKELLPALERRAGSSITNISSAITCKGVPGLSLYAATKGSVEALTKTLAIELAPKNIRVNAVTPGAIDTPIFGKLGIKPENFPEELKQAFAGIPLKRTGTSEEVAQVIVAQLESTYVTGAIWAVDGGVSIA